MQSRHYFGWEGVACLGGRGGGVLCVCDPGARLCSSGMLANGLGVPVPVAIVSAEDCRLGRGVALGVSSSNSASNGLVGLRPSETGVCLSMEAGVAGETAIDVVRLGGTGGCEYVQG